jgi:hypothetical protein
MKILSIIKYSFSLIGAIALVAAFYLYQSTHQFLASAQIVEGEVIDLIRVAPIQNTTSGGVTIRSESYTYSPAVRFVTQEGESIEFISSVSSNPPRFEIGEKLSVAYNPSAPKSARINDFIALWFAPLIFGGLGLLFFVIGGTMIAIGLFKGRQKEILKKSGKKIRTQFVDIKINSALVVNDKNPYQIHTQWKDPSTSTVHNFQSDNIWTDPTGSVPEEITVYIQHDNPKNYYVDLSFLPAT